MTLRDTLDEMIELDLERLGLLDSGRPHVARAVAHQQFIEAVPVVHLDASVVHLDLFVGLHIVPDQHFLLAADQRRPDLDRGEPVDVDVCDRVAGEVNGDERDIDESVEVRLAGRADGLRLLADEEVHDRQIMRRQIPYDTHVVLEETEVDPCGVVIIEIAEDAVVEELADLPDGPGEEERVVHHDLELVPLGQLDELIRLLGGGGKRLFDEEMLAVRQGCFGEFKMRVDGRHDGDGVDLCRGQQVGGIRGDGQARIRFGDPLERNRALITDRGDLAPVQTVHVTDDIWAPITVADDAHANHDLPEVRGYRKVGGRLSTHRHRKTPLAESGEGS